MTKKTVSLRLEPETHKKIKLLAVQNDVFPGQIIDAGVLLLERLSPLELAELLATYDDQHGHLVAGGEAEAVAEARNDQAIRAAEIETATKESD